MKIPTEQARLGVQTPADADIFKQEYSEWLSISALRIWLQDFDKAPAEVLKPYFPESVVNYAWIPQTVADQVWVMLQFETSEKRAAWEAELPEELKACLDRNLIERALPYGWYIRNVNGYY